MVKFQDDFYADVRIEDRSRTTISYKAGILEEMKTRVERRAFLRVYDGRMWYYASVTDLAHLQKTLDDLYAAATPNAQTAAVLDEAPTGNARAIDCTFEPIVRMTTTYIEGGDMDFDQLIAPIQKGYFIKTIRHGSGMSTFTIAPHLAYEIVDGKLGRPVQISVLTGSVFETLGLIDGLTRVVHLLSFVTGGCGKMEQMNLPVGFGGPYVRVSSMNVQ